MKIVGYNKDYNVLIASATAGFDKISSGHWICTGSFAESCFHIVKEKLLERFPKATIEKVISNIGSKKYYHFTITFKDESDEAEFILQQEYFEIDFTDFWFESGNVQ